MTADEVADASLGISIIVVVLILSSWVLLSMVQTPTGPTPQGWAQTGQPMHSYGAVEDDQAYSTGSGGMSSGSGLPSVPTRSNACVPVDRLDRAVRITPLSMFGHRPCGGR